MGAATCAIDRRPGLAGTRSLDAEGLPFADDEPVV